MSVKFNLERKQNLFFLWIASTENIRHQKIRKGRLENAIQIEQFVSEDAVLLYSS